MTSNMSRAAQVLERCWSLGVREVVLCAGARNAPLVELLSQQQQMQVHPFFDERSAGFFALGRMLATGRVVAVVTTSGTAVAELLPAVIESDYQGQPLLVISADRPRNYRGTGAPQTIDQVGLFSHYVESTWDLEQPDLWAGQWSRKRPAHLNLAFYEPLIDGPANLHFDATPLPTKTSAAATEVAQLVLHKPLILVSGLPLDQTQAVLQTLRAWQRPVYLEGPSHGRGQLGEWEVLGGEKSLAQLDYDSVIRVGTVPTVRLWRDLENSAVPVLHFSHLRLAGLPRAPQVSTLEQLRDWRGPFQPWSEEERTRDRALAQQISSLLERFPWSEPAWFRWLSLNLPQRSMVFLGNSLPIREWDLAAVGGDFAIFANRGVNGIDGLVSTFLGLTRGEGSHWCVLGDLSAMYDLNALWAAREWRDRDLNVVVINNYGGKIFTRMFHNPLFENQHAIKFRGWAEMWGWEYLHLQSTRDVTLTSEPRRRILEIVPDAQQTAAFWQAWEKLGSEKL
jgi:2-succinyl-5-enolpyruvyl-6-hydroxy-3-cyclohexene-1-carboxylate synthase